MSFPTERTDDDPRIGIALALCLGVLMIMPASMAALPNEMCVLDISFSIPIDHGFNVAPTECIAVTVAAETVEFRMPGGDEEEAAGPSMTMAYATFAPPGHRQHEDPGRDLV